MHSKQDLESELLRVIKRLSVPYRNAVDELVKTVAELTENSSQSYLMQSNILGRFQPAMEMINEHEQVMQPLVAQWNQNNFKAVGFLKNALDQHAALLEQLINLITQVEQLMTEKKRQIAPQVDASIQQSKARNAYRVSMS